MFCLTGEERHILASNLTEERQRKEASIRAIDYSLKALLAVDESEAMETQQDEDAEGRSPMPAPPAHHGHSWRGAFSDDDWLDRVVSKRRKKRKQSQEGAEESEECEMYEATRCQFYFGFDNTALMQACLASWFDVVADADPGSKQCTKCVALRACRDASCPLYYPSNNPCVPSSGTSSVLQLSCGCAAPSRSSTLVTFLE